MSQWRRIALEKVPLCRREIESAWSPMSMWIELRSSLEDAYSRRLPNEDVIRQIYDYALWCYNQSRNGDLVNAVLCAFFEHLPEHEKVRRDLPNRLSFETFSNLELCFRYHLTDKEFKEFKKEFLSGKKRPRVAPLRTPTTP